MSHPSYAPETNVKLCFNALINTEIAWLVENLKFRKLLKGKKKKDIFGQDGLIARSNPPFSVDASL